MLTAFTVLAVSCSQEFEDSTYKPQDIVLECVTISVDGEGTRTFIGDDGKSINWCESDRIAIYDGYALREFTIVEGSINGKSASFEGQIAADATTLTAIYPYDAATLTEGALQLSAAEAQSLGEHSVADGALLSIAEFEKGAESFKFNNVMGFLRVNITKDDVSSIIVNGSNIAGLVEANGDGTIAEVVEGKTQVTLTPAGETFAIGTYYVALLPGTTPAGEFRMTFVRNGATALEMVAKKEISIPRNAGFNVEYAPATEKFVISDAATLEQFLSEAASLEEGTVVEVVNDIDLTGVTLTPATSFVGVLEGNNHSLKNWTSKGVALFESLAGSVKNLTIDSSCVLTPADSIGAFGFVAKSMSATAVLDNVVNNADITLNTTIYGAGSSQNDDAVYFGALVGQSAGTIRNCKNNADIIITSAPTGGDERGIVYIGGVAGKADGTLDTCHNSGDLSYSVTDRGGYLFMGGVAGGTTVVPCDDIEASYGTATNCVNTGSIYHTFTKDIIGSGNAKSNYINLAGVVGYWIGSIDGCVNGEKDSTTAGKIQLAAPTLETGDGYSAANVSVAGVSCYAYDKATNCTNYGAIEVDGSFGPGYETYIGGGNKEDGGTFIAGVVAQVGAFDQTNSSHEISNCHNYGALDLNLPITSTSGTNYKNYHHAGGVVAYANAAATNLSNNATINILSQGTMNYLGGVIGQTDADATNLTNNGDIYIAVSRVGGNQLNNSNQLFGGVIGYNTGDKMTNLVNNNPISLTINNTNQKMRFGGVAGSFGNASTITNNGKVTLTDLASHAKEIDLGGISGATTSGTITNLINNGDVEYTGVETTGTTYFAGVVGYASSTTMEQIYNNNPIKVKADELGSSYIAGVFGSEGGSLSDIANYADITVDVPTIKALYLAGVAGTARSAAECHNCDNEGALKANGGTTLYLAGIVGQSGGNVKFYDSANSGALTYNAPEFDAKDLYAAGICARPYAKSVYDNCTNSGAISVSAKSASAACYLGGIAAQVSNATSAGNGYDVENCSVTGDIYINCEATWYVGGAIAYGSQWSSTTSNHRIASNNTVDADIEIASKTIAHYVGGIIGHSGVHTDISDNSYTGTITVGSNDSSKLSNVGGIVGALIISQTSATSTMNAEFSISGNSVDATINYDATNGYGGMLLGAINNIASRTSYTNYSQLSLAFEDNTIKSGSTINSTAITAENVAEYVMSNYDYTGRYELTIEGIDTTIVE